MTLFEGRLAGSSCASPFEGRSLEDVEKVGEEGPSEAGLISSPDVTSRVDWVGLRWNMFLLLVGRRGMGRAIGGFD